MKNGLHTTSNYHLVYFLKNFFLTKNLKIDKDVKQALVQFFASKDEISFEKGINKLTLRCQKSWLAKGKELYFIYLL